jgi:polar amino acid transport system substrate-binding protein
LPFLLFSQDTVYFDTANPPFMYGSDHTAQGIYPAIVQEIYRITGKPVQCISIPWIRALAEVKNTNSGIGGIYFSDERSEFLDFSEPLYQENLVIYTLNSSKLITSIQDLENMRIGVIRGWSYGKEFDEQIKAIFFIVEENSSDILNFRKLLEARLDAVIAVDISGDKVIEKLQVQEKVVKNTYSIHLPVYLAFNKSMNKKNDLVLINSTIKQINDSGMLSRIVSSEINKSY